MQISTDAELAAAIERTKQAATMITLDCDCIEVVEGTHEAGAELDCTDHGPRTIADALPTYIV
ncbi:hypothetical protein B1813_22830 [Saccharomonospora piscinae]|uniref:Uncharacterized protein n=1 Tax=Saccharomonospora piscinae TaxID=687388 RepID=A0A1V8ZVZ3_SACPI|nr:hypothetical protein [Saccharomonospora piscinae]OQO88990.1 hypothetical protein B1813_22830 [Saccharomonospora piscinae]